MGHPHGRFGDGSHNYWVSGVKFFLVMDHQARMFGSCSPKKLIGVGCAYFSVMGHPHIVYLVIDGSHNYWVV
jgi:hypothetical protein